MIGRVYLEIFSSIWWVNILLAIFVVFLHRGGNPKNTAFWAMLLTFLPVVGFLLYLIFGQDYHKRNMFLLKKKQDEVVRLVLTSQRDDLIRGRFPFKNSRVEDYNELLFLNMTGKEGFYTENNEVKLFYDGRDKFKSLFNDIKKAKKSIDIQYYVFKNDHIGKALIQLLERKAKEGLSVRIIYDAVGGRLLTPKAFRRIEHYGGQVAKFFPSLFLWINLRINYRNHRKIAIIDDEIGYIGGFNVGDEYLGRNKRFGYWRDTHMRIYGDAIWGLKVRFLKDWYYASKDSSMDEEIITSSVPSKGNVGIQIVASGPDTEVEHIKFGLIKMISGAKKRIVIQTPYFIPDESLKDAILSAICSGVEVMIMVPCKPDHPFVYWATTSYLGEFAKYGARCFIYKNGFLHAKTMLVDDYVSTVGSANMDIRSFSLNFEANAFIYDEKVNEDLYQQFLIDCEKSEEITWGKYEKRSNWIKVKESVSRLLSPIL